MRALIQTAQLSLETLNASVPLVISEESLDSSDTSKASLSQQRVSSLSSCVKELTDSTLTCKDKLKRQVNDLKQQQAMCSTDTSGPSLLPLLNLTFNDSGASLASDDSLSPDSRDKYSMVQVTPNTLHLTVSNILTEDKEVSKKLYDFPVLSFATPERREEIAEVPEAPTDVVLASNLLSMDQRASYQHKRTLLAVPSADTSYRQRKLPLSSRELKCFNWGLFLIKN